MIVRAGIVGCGGISQSHATAYANLEDVTIVKGGQAIRIDARGVFEAGLDQSAFQLQSGDRIMVPSRREFGWTGFLAILQAATFVTTIISLSR